jgi:hypothetical protein
MLGSEFAAFGQFYSVDVTNAMVTPIGRTNSFYTDIDFSPDGVLWSATTSLMQIDPATGLTYSNRPLRFVGGPGNDLISGVTFSSRGEMYGIGNGNGNLWRIDPGTATAQFVGSSQQALFALEFGPGDRLFGVGFGLWDIDPLTGAARPIGTVGGGALISGLDFAPDGVLYGVSNQITTDSLYAIDMQTGAGTLIGRTGADLFGIASFPAPAPEPSTLTLLALGTLGLIGYGWRRRSASA